MEISDAFRLFFKGLARHAPGSDDATLRALRLCELPDEPVVYDMGAGTGASTLVLAEELETPVVAVDLLAESLDALRTRAERREIDDWVDTVEGDFLELDVEPGSIDLLWAEGSIYAAGWEPALDAWRPLLRPGGYLVASDCVWVTDDRPEAAVDFWSDEYPEMKTVAELEELARNAGFDVVEAFELPRRAWADYYGPLGQRAALVHSSDTADGDMRVVADAVQHEIDMWREYGDAVNYVFLTLRLAD